MAKIKTKRIFDVYTQCTCYDKWFSDTHTNKQLWSTNCEPLDFLQFVLPCDYKNGIAGVQNAMTRGAHGTVHIYSAILRFKHTNILNHILCCFLIQRDGVVVTFLKWCRSLFE